MPLYHSEPLDNSFCYLQAKCFQLLKPRGYGHEKHRFISIIETKVQSAPVCTCCKVCNRTDVRGSQDFLRIVVGCSKNDIKTLGWHESMWNHRFQTAHIKVHSEKQTHSIVIIFAFQLQVAGIVRIHINNPDRIFGWKNIRNSVKHVSKCGVHWCSTSLRLCLVTSNSDPVL